MVVQYETAGHVATITMNRPEVANAQSTELIDAIDAALDTADADDEVRVVILAGAGKHFSSGHDLKGLLSEDDEWVRLRETPEGKFRHEWVMYYGRCQRIYEFRKPTIAAVQGSCVAAGLMLACMCDLIVAADSAVFSNPVLRMTGAGVELLVEPWELGIRKAKEFLWTGEKIDATEAWRLGLVNRVVPAGELMERTRELAERIALVPPITAQVVKDSINHAADLMGKQQSWKYHFMAHHWAHNTATALDALEDAQVQNVDERGFRRAPGRNVTAAPLAGLRVIDVGTRIAAPFCAGLLGEQGAEVIKVEQPDGGDFMRSIGPFVTADDGPGYSLFWAVEGRGRKGVTLDLRGPAGQALFRRLAGRSDVVCENFRPGTMERWQVGPRDCDARLVWARISVFGQDGPYSARPGLDRQGIGYGGLLHLTGYPDRPPVRPGVTISDYLTGVFAAEAVTAALYGRDGPGGSGAGCVIDAPLYGSVLRVLEWTIAAQDRLGITRQREGNRVPNSAPLDNYPTSDGKYVCVVAGSDANFARLCRRWTVPIS